MGRGASCTETCKAQLLEMGETLSLRPGGISLRPGGGTNPFAGFAKGAGLGLKSKAGAMSALEDEKKKPRGEVVKYTREFLMKFAERYSQVPQELQMSNLDILLSPDDPEREAQKQLLQKVAADEADERDWRARAPLPAAEAGAAAGVAHKPRELPADPNAPKIQRAEDIGKTAWHAGAAPVEGPEQTLRKVKGILNKLTPEKFERLLSQLIPLVNSYEVVQGTIRQVFENAVAQPTFVVMYADLCHELDQALPEYPAPGEEKPMSFRKMLANTCQEEYEATEEARQKAVTLSGEEREEAVRFAKQRLLGNLRLIGQLFNKGMVNDRIVLLIMADLLGAQESDPPEESVEATCELIGITGAALEKSPKSKARLDAACTHLTRLSNNTKTYPSRVRFVIKDLLDQRAQNWVARRETFTAKKLEEIRSEAQAELGIVDVLPIPGMGAEGLPGVLPVLSQSRPAEEELFPAFKSNDASWQAYRRAGSGSEGGKFSAFLGDFVPIAEAGPAAGGAPSRAPRTDLSPEERESLAKSLFSDYLSDPRVEEAVAAAQELDVPGFMPKLVQIGLEKAFDTISEKEQLQLVDLIAALAQRGVVPADDLREGVSALTEQLEDIALDIPAAPRLLGRLLGSAAAAGLLGLEVVAQQAGPVESAEPRRNFIAAALQAVQQSGGDDKLRALVAEGQLDLPALLAHDPEFDGELEPASAFLQTAGLAVLA